MPPSTTVIQCCGILQYYYSTSTVLPQHYSSTTTALRQHYCSLEYCSTTVQRKKAVSDAASMSGFSDLTNIPRCQAQPIRTYVSGDRNGHGDAPGWR